MFLFRSKNPPEQAYKKDKENEQGAQIEKNLYSDPDFAASYEADKKYAEENGTEFTEMRDREVVALIAYIQRLGPDIKIKTPEKSSTASSN